MLGRGTYSHKNNSVRIEKIFGEDQGSALTLLWDTPGATSPGLTTAVVPCQGSVAFTT